MLMTTSVCSTISVWIGSEKKYEQAEAAFEHSLKTEHIDLQQKAFYNLGTTRHLIGKDHPRTAPQETLKIWEKVLKDFKSALDLDPKDENARYNHNQLALKIEELKNSLPLKTNRSSKRRLHNKTYLTPPLIRTRAALILHSNDKKTIHRQRLTLTPLFSLLLPTLPKRRNSAAQPPLNPKQWHNKKLPLLLTLLLLRPRTQPAT